MDTLTARMPNPAVIIPEAMKPIQALFGSVSRGGVPQATLELVHLRVSQVNGCSACVDGGWRKARKAGESDERLFAVAAWREAQREHSAASPDMGLSWGFLAGVRRGARGAEILTTTEPLRGWVLVSRWA